MKVAITSTTILEIPDTYAQHYDTEALAREFRAANEWAIDKPWVTVSGIPYTFRALEEFKLEVRR